ncbi:hypothetical protein HN873_014119, partial [Arachis hypogaea]
SPLGFFAATIDSAAAGRSRKGRGGRRQTRRHQLQPSLKLGQIVTLSSFLGYRLILLLLLGIMKCMKLQGEYC